MNKTSSNHINVTEIIAPLVAITMELDSVISKLLRNEFDMSLADFKILRAIFILNESTQLDISCFNHVTEAAVSKRLKFLVNERLIRKTTSTEDKRKSVLTLTAKGKVYMSKLQAVIVAKMESVLSDFSNQKRRQTKQLLTEVLIMTAEQSHRKNVLEKIKHPVLKYQKKCRLNKQ